MTMLLAFLWVLVAHFIGDFVLQSNWMAQNKSKSNAALGAHVLVYTTMVAAAGAGVAYALRGVPYGAVLVWIAFNGAAHFATDYVTSRINAKLWEAKRVHDFFVGVGADQLIHAITLGLTLMLLLAEAA